MNELDKLFTNSFSTDIVILSSFLSLQAFNEPGATAGWVTPPLNLLNNISTLLTIGHISNSMNAIVGNINATTVKCLVFTNPIASQDQHIRGVPATKTQGCSLKSFKLDPKRGAELLNNWTQSSSDYTFEVYLWDTFNIINYMQSTQNPADLGKFLFFTHHRGFQQLGIQVKEFFEHWGNFLPFEILEGCLNALTECLSIQKQLFNIELNPVQYKVVQMYVEAVTVDLNRGYLFEVTVNNII
ncbi:hypothetical protein GYMLUDRAFT_237210 [Collybiopsis luxurians FD-317 M1]|nr:hypothetical protein GYMLUDRAFT_237210 [Collybiopsis luxurians FD-317 M1]